MNWKYVAFVIGLLVWSLLVLATGVVVGNKITFDTITGCLIQMKSQVDTVNMYEIDGELDKDYIRKMIEADTKRKKR